eukprot:1153820-Pelagomonas_calceolata.AAC.1
MGNNKSNDGAITSAYQSSLNAATAAQSQHTLVAADSRHDKAHTGRGRSLSHTKCHLDTQNPVLERHHLLRR